jgi:hypothetical protein
MADAVRTKLASDESIRVENKLYATALVTVGCKLLHLKTDIETIYNTIDKAYLVADYVEVKIKTLTSTDTDSRVNELAFPDPFMIGGIKGASQLTKAVETVSKETSIVSKVVNKLIGGRCSDDVVNVSGKIVGETGEIVGLEIKAGELHHIASNKAINSGFTKEYQEIFNKAGMRLDDAANKIFLEGHSGGHTIKYKQYVLDYLKGSTEGLSGDAYKKALQGSLDDLGKQLKKNPRMPYKGGL